MVRILTVHVHHFSRHNTSLRVILRRDELCYNPLFSKGLGVPHILLAPFRTGRIRPVLRPLILCSARILRSYRTESESRPIGLIR